MASFFHGTLYHFHDGNITLQKVTEFLSLKRSERWGRETEIFKIWILPLFLSAYRLDVVIEEKLIWMGSESQCVHLFGPLVAYPHPDNIFRKYIALQ